MKMLKVENLKASIGEVEILKGIDLEIGNVALSDLYYQNYLYSLLGRLTQLLNQACLDVLQLIWSVLN